MVTYIFYSLKPTRIKVNIIIEVQMKKKSEKVNDSTFDEIIWQQTPIERGEAVIRIHCRQ